MTIKNADGNIYLTERAAAAADIAGDGQLWVENTTPNKLKFTDDAGTDQDILTTLDTQAVVQVVHTQDGTVATGTTLCTVDDTIPQSTEGDQLMTLAITPKSATNILVIETSAMLSSSGAAYIQTALFKDSDTDALAAMEELQSPADSPLQSNITHYMVAGTTSTITFKLRGGSTTGTTTFNGNATNQRYNGVAASTITITEYQP